MRAPDHATSHDLPDIAADLLTRLRQQHPRVHCVTNAVAQHFTANVLLAIGATPSMTMSPNEVEHFVRDMEIARSAYVERVRLAERLLGARSGVAATAN